MKLKQINFRATEERRQKLQMIAAGEGISVNEVLNRLVDEVPVKSVVRQVENYRLNLSGNANSRSAQVLAGECATAVSQ